MIPVILSGGVGSRLWPLSRGMYPKQLLPLVDNEQTMLQATVDRLSGVCDTRQLIIVCNQEHRFMVAEQLAVMGCQESAILLEPQGRNTAPAVALAALHARQNFPDQAMAVFPADHLIQDIERFHAALDKAQVLADQGYLVTFGVKPASPHTGYGYIKAGQKIDGNGFQIAEFKEKPDVDTAKQYVQSGNYFWNSGMFVFKPSVYLQELGKYAPNMLKACQAAYQASKVDLDFIRIDEQAFSHCPSDSIDYAVMEQTTKSAVVSLQAQWSDIGSWSSLWQAADKDDENNIVIGDVLCAETHNSYLRGSNRLVATVGVSDLVVVDTDDALLVADKNKLDGLKTVVEQLKQQGRPQTLHHRKVFRPWGWYDSIDAGENFQVKRIQVKPQAKLSLQKHHHRAEHWVVVSGQAEVRNGENTFLLEENQSTYIPVGTIHSLRNPSETIPLQIIEVQTGSYLGEDDIVRYQDDYGRA